MMRITTAAMATVIGPSLHGGVVTIRTGRTVFAILGRSIRRGEAGMVQMSGGLPFDAATVARINIEGCGFKLQHPARAVLCFAHGVILQRVPGRAPGWVYWVGYALRAETRTTG